MTQEITATLLGDDVLVDPPRRDVVGLGERFPDEPFVVPEIEVRLGAVVRDVYLAVLEWRHRAGINVDVRVELLDGHGDSALDQQPADRCRGNALAERGYHSSGYEDVSCRRSIRHGRIPLQVVGATLVIPGNRDGVPPARALLDPSSLARAFEPGVEGSEKAWKPS
jgi:hypothetical protein